MNIMKKVMLQIVRHAVQLEGSAALAISRKPACVMRLYKHSAATKEPIPEHVVTTNSRGNVILFWHPERDIPYEHTKPISEVSRTSTVDEESNLSAKFKPDVNSQYAKYGPTSKELCEMFYTTKHRFYPRPGIKRAKKDTPKDRNAL